MFRCYTDTYIMYIGMGLLQRCSGIVWLLLMLSSPSMLHSHALAHPGYIYHETHVYSINSRMAQSVEQYYVYNPVVTYRQECIRVGLGDNMIL